MFDMFANRT